MPARGATVDLGELFRQHGPMVYRRALRLLSRPEDADEATQEVFLRVMRSVDTFEGRSGITTWLYQITTHYCLNLIRDRGRRRQLLEQNLVFDGTGPDEGGSAAASDLLLLRQLLAEADEQQAQAAVYVYLDGMNHEEAAELLGVSKRTVGNLLERFLSWASRRTEEKERKNPKGADDREQGAQIGRPDQQSPRKGNPPAGRRPN